MVRTANTKGNLETGINFEAWLFASSQVIRKKKERRETFHSVGFKMSICNSPCLQSCNSYQGSGQWAQQPRSQAQLSATQMGTPGDTLAFGGESGWNGAEPSRM